MYNESQLQLLGEVQAHSIRGREFSRSIALSEKTMLQLTPFFIISRHRPGGLHRSCRKAAESVPNAYCCRCLSYEARFFGRFDLQSNPNVLLSVLHAYKIAYFFRHFLEKKLRTHKNELATVNFLQFFRFFVLDGRIATPVTDVTGWRQIRGAVGSAAPGSSRGRAPVPERGAPGRRRECGSGSRSRRTACNKA